MDATLIAFILVAGALVVSPGPDSILILRNTMSSGSLPGLMTVFGVQVGVSLHALLSVTGLSVLLYYSPLLFRALAFAGAGYLVYIGYMTLRHGLMKAGGRGLQVRPRRAFWQGMLCNVLNPKVIILFVALMPTFINFERDDVQRQLIILALLLLAINIPFQVMLVLIAARVQVWLNSPRFSRVFCALLGGVLIFFALALFIEHVINYAQSAAPAGGQICERMRPGRVSRAAALDPLIAAAGSGYDLAGHFQTQQRRH